MFKHVYIVLIGSLIVTLSIAGSASRDRQTQVRATAVKDSNKVAKQRGPPRLDQRKINPKKKPKQGNVPPVRRTTVPTTAVKDPYLVAEQKCVEYGDARYINRTIENHVPGRPPIINKIMKCFKVEQLIVSGTKAAPMEFPHMALIGYHDTVPSPEYEKWICGGTLISERFVLSAAHCATYRLPARWVRLGELILENDNDGSSPRDFRIVQIIPYPKYRSPSVYHDIALFRLERAVTFNQFMRPICLHTARTLPNFYGDEAVITGWGTTGYGERLSEHLLKATVKFIIESDCKKNYANDNKLINGFDTATMVCAGNKAKLSDTCQRDSGGPIQVPKTDWICMWTQIGITSYGSAACGNKAVPAIYTRVAYYIPWIQPIVWP